MSAPVRFADSAHARSTPCALSGAADRLHRNALSYREAAVPTATRCRSCCCMASVRARHRGCSSSKRSARRGACSHGMRRVMAHPRRSRPASPVASDYAAALNDWLDALDIERCVLVGHSLGAIIAGAFAAEHAPRVAGLLLVSPAGGYGAASAEVRETKRDAASRDARTNSARKVSPKNAAPTCCPRTRATKHATWVRWNMARMIPHGYAQATHLLANADLAADLARYRGRISVAVGADDAITPPAACERIAQAAGASLQVCRTRATRATSKHPPRTPRSSTRSAAPATDNGAN